MQTANMDTIDKEEDGDGQKNIKPASWNEKELSSLRFRWSSNADLFTKRSPAAAEQRPRLQGAIVLICWSVGRSSQSRLIVFRAGSFVSPV